MKIDKWDGNAVKNALDDAIRKVCCICPCKHSLASLTCSVYTPLGCSKKSILLPQRKLKIPPFPSPDIQHRCKTLFRQFAPPPSLVAEVSSCWGMNLSWNNLFAVTFSCMLQTKFVSLVVWRTGHLLSFLRSNLHVY